MRRLPVLCVLALTLVLVPAAGAKPMLGVFGGIERFDRLTSQRTDVGHAIFGWGNTRFPQQLRLLRSTPLVGVVGGPSPLAVSRGKGDAYLFALNQALADFGGPVYVRPWAEMNGHWNTYSAFTSTGKSKGPAYSTAAFRKAFARMYVIVHGGSADKVNAQLARLKLPPVSRDLAENPLPRVKVVWNPQGFGSPNIPANSAAAYYPGHRYVDVVANDLYHINGKAAWDAAERLYRAYPNKPHAIAEWGLWGMDDPSFIERMARFVRARPRIEFLAYYNGRPGSPWDLGTKPRSRAAYKRLIVPLAR